MIEFNEQVAHVEVDLADLCDRLAGPDAAAAYRVAQPFPHLVIDDALPADVFARAAAEFPKIDDPIWNGYLHVNESKYASADPEQWGPTLKSLARALLSDEFVAVLRALTGFETLVADRQMDGGGLHQTVRGGHLNIHADFTTHHQDSQLCRRVNLLLYLNREWSQQWGGDLELWDSEVTSRIRAVAPLPNRILLFTTSGDAYHGHPEPLDVPPGVARRSLALYYFTREVRPARRATAYRARPGDGVRRISIWADRHGLAAYDVVKRRFRLSDRVAHRALSRIDRLRRRKA